MKDYIKAQAISFGGFIPCLCLLFLYVFNIRVEYIGSIELGLLAIVSILVGFGVFIFHPRTRHYNKHMLQSQHDFDQNYRFEPEGIT